MTEESLFDRAQNALDDNRAKAAKVAMYLDLNETAFRMWMVTGIIERPAGAKDNIAPGLRPFMPTLHLRRQTAK